jgi:DNA polymerase elongation subunit (family B)
MNYADVESLYPSIMLVYKIQPQGDYMKLFPTLLRELTDKRFESKNIMRKLKSEGKEYGAVDAKQAALKILINSFYGMLGHSGSMFNDFYEADRVTHTGQQLLRRMMEIITKKGGDIILVDTDGVLYCLPRPNMTDDEVDGFVQEVSDAMPKGINVGNDGRFDKVLAYAKKNYVLVERGSGKVKFKGVSFKGRHLEPFGKSYIRQICLALLNEDIVQVHRTHTEYVGLIVNRLLTKDDIRSRATLKKSLCEYDEGITSGNNPIVQYEIAKKFQERTGVLVHPGDVMEYYVAGTRKKSHIRSYIDGKHISQWEDDYSIVHYMSRLKKMAQKFSDFFSKEDFQIVFTMDPQKIDQGNLFFPSIDPRVKTVTIKRNRITK